MGRYSTCFLLPVVFAKAVCWHPHFSTYFDTAIHMALDVHRQEERGIKVAYLLDADLVGNRQNLKFETLVTDLEYADDMALLATTTWAWEMGVGSSMYSDLSDNWMDLTTMLHSLATTCK